MSSSTDLAHMHTALALAAHGLYTTRPNPRVGCVLTDAAGFVVGQGWHRRAGEPHAEVHALAEAGAAARGGTAYVTLEPCAHHGRTPPCADALIAAGVARVVVACEDSFPAVAGQGIARLRAAGIAVELGVAQAEARALNAGFFSRIERGRPWVRIKLAASLDGRTALADGRSQWITGPLARADGHHWRAQAGAILSSAATVLADDARLDARLADGAHLAPQWRVVLDRQGRIGPLTRLWQTAGPLLLVRDDARAGAPTGRTDRLNWSLPLIAPDRFDLAAVLQRLSTELQIDEVHVEAGPTLAGALIAAGLADELLLYLAPRLLGATGRPLVAGPIAEPLDAPPAWQLLACTPLGEDLRLRYLRHPAAA